MPAAREKGCQDGHTWQVEWASAGPWKRSVPKERVVPSPSVQRQAIQVRKVHQHKASREASPERDDPICELHHPRGAELLVIVRKILTPTRHWGEHRRGKLTMPFGLGGAQRGTKPHTEQREAVVSADQELHVLGPRMCGSKENTQGYLCDLQVQ